MDVPATYEVPCFSCGALFDACASSWCSCLAVRRSLVCPTCLDCFCRAPSRYKQKFWKEAPESLWEARQLEGKAGPRIPNPPPQACRRPLVLLVEFEPPIPRIARRVIEAMDYGMILARRGDEALELVNSHQPDLVLTRALLPGIDGRKLSETIKTNPSTSRTKVVLMTSIYRKIAQRHEALDRFRADAFLLKPVSFRDLQATLREHLG